MATERRLIDANELLEAIEGTDWYTINYKGEASQGAPCEEVAWYKATDIYRAIENAPNIEAKEVVHGRWELHGNDDDCGCSYFCSNCHRSYDEDYFYVHGQYRHFNYCPHCGAKMDGDGNG